MNLSCQILMRPPAGGRYIIGQSITGVVKYTLNKPTQYKKISLSLVGIGQCKWFQQSKITDPGPMNSIKKYEGNENVMIEMVLIDDRRANSVIQPGTYEHQFEIQLPMKIPPSVKTNICEIDYHVQLEFVKPSPLKMSKKFRTKNIIIYPSVPMMIPDQPIYFGLDKNLIKLFNNKKKHVVHLKAKLDNGYLVPEKDSKIDFVVTNDSDVNAIVKTELICKINYIDNCGNMKSEEEIVKKLNSPKVPENSVANLFSMIEVGSDVYTVTYSKVMSREYKLKFTLRLPIPYINSTVEMPIVIADRVKNEVVLTEEATSHWQEMSEIYNKD